MTMNFFLNEKKEISKNIKTIVLVDYESWVYGCKNQYQTVPELFDWFDDLKQRGTIHEILFFADFSQDSEMKSHTLKLRNLSNSIIDCAKGSHEKDYTDFILIDHLYRRLIQQTDCEQFVIVSGDAHFQSALAFLRHFNNKVVGVYALKGSLSAQLKETASWYVEMCPSDERRQRIESELFGNLRWVKEQAGLIPSFARTVAAVVRNNSEFTEGEVGAVLSRLILEERILQVESVIPSSGSPVRQLVVVEEGEAASNETQHITFAV